MSACKAGYMEIVDILLEKGAELDVNQQVRVGSNFTEHPSWYLCVCVVDKEFAVCGGRTSGSSFS